MMRRWFQHWLQKLNSEQNKGNLQKCPCCPEASCHVPGREGWAQLQLLICFLLKQGSQARRRSQEHLQEAATLKATGKPCSAYGKVFHCSSIFTHWCTWQSDVLYTSGSSSSIVSCSSRGGARFRSAECRTTFAGRRKEVLLSLNLLSLFDSLQPGLGALGWQIRVLPPVQALVWPQLSGCLS